VEGLSDGRHELGWHGGRKYVSSVGVEDDNSYHCFVTSAWVQYNAESKNRSQIDS